MPINTLDSDDRFQPAAKASISLLFDRLQRDGIRPLMLYCVDSGGFPLAVFSTPFSADVNDAIGATVTGAMEVAQLTLTQ